MTTPEPDIISPQAARAAIQRAIVARLGADWDGDGGWEVVHQSDYFVRLSKGSVNLDVACDLLGEVSFSESALNPLQASGRLVAWMVLGASLLIALAIAWASGVL